MKNWLIWKDPDAGKDWRREVKGTTRMRWLDGITDSMDMSLSKLGVGNGQGCLMCCSLWDYKESYMTEQLIWTESLLLCGSQQTEKFLKMGIPDHLTCLLRILYVDQEVRVRTRTGTMDWFQMGKGVWQECILSPCRFNLYGEYIMWNAGLDEA